MRLHILSDLHLEFDAFELPAVEAEVTIIAGDLGTGLLGVRWLRQNIPERPVLYVLGNHEFYDHSIPRLTERIRNITRGTNVTLLENDSIRLGDITFLGATLWTDLELDGDRDRAEAVAFNWMADYNAIRFSEGMRRLRPSDLLAMHHESRAWLEKTAVSIKTPKVIITHHAPHPKSISPKHLNSPLNPAFVSDLTPLIHSTNAKLWIHGHTHTNCDYTIGQTRIINNPRGYELENIHFRPALVIELNATD
jgi:predicted phosphodiesterase